MDDKDFFMIGKGSKSDTKKSKRTKKNKKNKIPSLPNEMIIIPNAMKGGWVEKWTPDRNIGCIPASFRCLLLGGVGFGKTNVAKQIILRHQSTDRPFKHLWIITCSDDNIEWDDMEPDGVFTSIPPLHLFTEGNEKVCIVLDDMEQSNMNSDEQRKLSTLFRFVSSHHNCSLIMSYQSFFDCSKICRKVANVFVVYKPNSRTEMTNIDDRTGLEKGTLKTLFKKFCTSPYDPVVIDMTINSPAKLRKGLYDPIVYDDSESE